MKKGCCVAMYKFAKKQLLETEIYNVTMYKESVNPVFNTGCPSGPPSGGTNSYCDEHAINKPC